MKTNRKELLNQIEKTIKEINFSGNVLVKEKGEIVHEFASGYSNQSEQMPNNIDTRFGIASGCKIFTAIGICQLVEKGTLSFDTKVTSYLPYAFPYFDESVTIHHLLTHTSGIPDYFDEETMDDFADLWKERPMYSLLNLHDFLPMFQHQKMLFNPGDKFHYNNAGFILLGLIIEKATNTSFREYIKTEVFDKIGMSNSGYFSMDQLPNNTAIGYIDNGDGTMKSNIYSLPIIGGPDGGAFITSSDMATLWEKLIGNELLTSEMTKRMLTPHVQENEDEYYGYGVWMTKKGDDIYKFHVMGYDPGVSFHSGYYPANELIVVIPSNKSKGPFTLTKQIEDWYENEK